MSDLPQLGERLINTGELCPNCNRRDCIAVFDIGNGETVLACEICDYREDAVLGGSPRG